MTRKVGSEGPDYVFEKSAAMEIVRNSDGSLVVPIAEARHHDSDGEVAATSDQSLGGDAGTTTRLLHPGEGGYNEALAEWDMQQSPERAEAVSTAGGCQAAMSVVHTIAESSSHDVVGALEGVDDPESSGEALRHVLIGGTHSVEAFSNEVSQAEGGEPLPSHKMTTIIGEVLAELDK